MRVAVVAEFYPRSSDPVLGIWAHRQALAARDAGAEPVVFVLHRLVPPASSFTPAEFLSRWREPRFAQRDGIPVHYLAYVSPPRPRFYARWGAWAAPPLRRAMRRHGPFELIHAHNAIPAADAALSAGVTRPLVVSVHGADVLWTARNVPHGAQAVRRALDRARLTLANSAGIAELARAAGAREATVVHLGSDLPAQPPPRSPQPLLVTVGHLVARKRHTDVIRALAALPEAVRYLVIGDGPERGALRRLADQLGVGDRVELAGQLDPETALQRAREAWLFVMPSTDEAFGVAYIEAMAAGIPAIGAAGEAGPREIAAAGAGIELVPSGDPGTLAQTISELLADRERLDALARAARQTVAEHFSWGQCGRATVAAYEAALS